MKAAMDVRLDVVEELPEQNSSQPNGVIQPRAIPEEVKLPEEDDYDSDEYIWTIANTRRFYFKKKFETFILKLNLLNFKK